MSETRNRSSMRTMEWIGALGPIVNVLMMVGAIYAYLSVQGQGAATLNQKFSDFQSGVDTQLATIEAAIASLPAQGVVVAQLQDHLHSIDLRLDNLDGRTRSIETAVAGDRADLNNIISSDHVSLGPRGHR